MFDSVVSSREIYEDYAGDFPCFKAVFDVLGEVQHLGSTIFAGRKPACSGIRMYSIMGDRRGGSVSGAHTVCNEVRGDTK